MPGLDTRSIARERAFVVGYGDKPAQGERVGDLAVGLAEVETVGGGRVDVAGVVGELVGEEGVRAEGGGGGRAAGLPAGDEEGCDVPGGVGGAVGGAVDCPMLVAGGKQKGGCC